MGTARKNGSSSSLRHRTVILSRVLRKPDNCLCENKGADQLRSKCEADQRLSFRYTEDQFSRVAAHIK